MHSLVTDTQNIIDFMMDWEPTYEKYGKLFEKSASNQRQISGVITCDNAFVGIVGIRNITQSPVPSGEVYILVHSDYRNRGIGTAAVQDVIKYAFQMHQPSFKQLEATVLATNEFSLRIFTQLGFVPSTDDQPPFKGVDDVERPIWHGTLTNTNRS